jgi:hypothetical protein
LLLLPNRAGLADRRAREPPSLLLLLLPALPMLKLLFALSGLCGERLLLQLFAGMPLNATDLVALGERATGVALFAPAAGVLPAAWLPCPSCSSSAGSGDSSSCVEPSFEAASNSSASLPLSLAERFLSGLFPACLAAAAAAASLPKPPPAAAGLPGLALRLLARLDAAEKAPLLPPPAAAAALPGEPGLAPAGSGEVAKLLLLLAVRCTAGDDPASPAGDPGRCCCSSASIGSSSGDCV